VVPRRTVELGAEPAPPDRPPQSGDHLRRRKWRHRTAVANRAGRTGRQPRRTSTTGWRPTRRPGHRRPTQHRPSRRCGAGLRQRRG
jgi:hypothetical protein